MAGGVLVWQFSPQNPFIFMVFVLVQILGTKWEEGKFMNTLRDYKDFAVQSGSVQFMAR